MSQQIRSRQNSRRILLWVNVCRSALNRFRSKLTHPTARKQQWILVSLIALVTSQQSIYADEGVAGDWVVPGKDAVVRINPSKNGLSLIIIRTLDPELRDRNNPDKAQQSNLMAGTILGQGFKEKGGGWSGGQIYDPTSGKLYNANLHLIDNNHLKVRGYIGLPVLGRSQIWVRLATFHDAMTNFLSRAIVENSVTEHSTL